MRLTLDQFIRSVRLARKVDTPTRDRLDAALLACEGLPTDALQRIAAVTDPASRLTLLASAARATSEAMDLASLA